MSERTCKQENDMVAKFKAMDGLETVKKLMRAVKIKDSRYLSKLSSNAYDMFIIIPIDHQCCFFFVLSGDISRAL